MRLKNYHTHVDIMKDNLRIQQMKNTIAMKVTKYLAFYNLQAMDMAAANIGSKVLFIHLF